MKRCPQCNRLEPDDTLAYCRADGTALISDSGSVNPEAGTVKFGSAPVSREIQTSVLPQMTTDAGISRPTAQTTVLSTPLPSQNTRERRKPKQRKGILAMAAVIAVALIAGVYLYWPRGKNTAQIESIAVMPFVNESGNAEVEYLSDGMTETLISSLSQLPHLNVKARSTVFRYKGKATDAQTIGKELNVEAILNGRVVQRGDHLTLSLELINAQTENVIWTDKYDRKSSDLVSLQNEIARDVSGKLKTKLSGADQQKLVKTYTTNPDAYKLYLQGRFYWNKREEKDFRKAAESYNKE